MKEHATKKKEPVIADCEFQDAASKVAFGKGHGNLFVNRKRILYWSIAIVIAVVATICAFHFDDAMHNYITAHQNRGLQNFMRNVSRFGDWPEHLAFGLVGAGVAWLGKNKKWTRVFLSMLLACAIAGTVARAVKIETGRARPSVKSEEVWNGPRLSSKYHAFPSGHTAASTAFFAVLFFVNWRIALACFPIPIAIALSRMYVTAHYLSDVVVAAMLGILAAYLVTRWLLGEIENRQSEI